MRSIPATVLVLAALAVAACERKAEPVAAPVPSPPPAAVPEAAPVAAASNFDHAAFAGTYEGTLPCADCAGVRTTIVFDVLFAWMMGCTAIPGRRTSELRIWTSSAGSSGS